MLIIILGKLRPNPGKIDLDGPLFTRWKNDRVFSFGFANRFQVWGGL